MLNQDTPISVETTVTSTETMQQPEVQAAPVSQPSLLDSLADDLKTAKSLGNFKDVNELAKSYLNAQSLIGKRISDMSGDDLKALDAIRGVPEAPEKYVLPEELPSEVTDAYKEIASQAKLTQEQAKTVLDSYIMLERKAQEAAAAQQQQFKETSVETLKKEFGLAFDQKLEIAKRAVSTFGGDELKQALNETGLGDHPAFVKVFAKIGQQLLEDTTVEADKATTFGVSPAEADAMIQNKMLDPEFRQAYISGHHPGHSAAVAEMARLYELKGGAR